MINVTLKKFLNVLNAQLDSSYKMINAKPVARIVNLVLLLKIVIPVDQEHIDFNMILIIIAFNAENVKENVRPVNKII